MSTKIYNGYKLPNMSLLELKEFTDKLRGEIRKTCNKMFYDKAALIITNIIDSSYVCSKEKLFKKYNIKEDEMNFSLFFKTWDTINKKNKKISKTQERNPLFDFSCEICLIPIEDKILCLYFGEAKEYLNTFTSFKEISSYYYYNNVDKPEDVPEEEWKQREKDWAKALPGIGIPSENGFIVELNKDIPFIELGMLEEIIRNIPSFEARVNKTAIEKAINDNVKDESYDDYSKVYDWLKTDEGQLCLNENKKELEKILPKEITKEILTSNIKDLLR